MSTPGTYQWTTLANDLACENLYVGGKAFLPSDDGGQTTPPFLYTATGSEDPSGFPVAFPAARADTNYVAQVQVSAAAGFNPCDAPPADWTLSGITVRCAAPLSAPPN